MPVTKDKHIELIAKYVEQDQKGYYSVFFERPNNFEFEAGDWMDIQFENKDLRGGKTYSLSSSPTESDLRISFREGVSEFKNALQSIKGDEKLYITQYGNDYGFKINKNQSSFFIAGGVGIAPFRSMIKEMYDTSSKNEVALIYLTSSDDFLFKEELDIWSKALSGLTIHYIKTNEINRKKREKIIVSLINKLNQNFYISGPPQMVESNEHLLIDCGVKIRDIRIDIFGGY